MKYRSLNLRLIIISTAIFIFIYHGFNLIYLWSDIPNQIAIHFSNGKPDNWGTKFILFIMPIISVLIWFFMGLLVKSPEKLNYVNLTEDNKKNQYSKAEKVTLLIQYFGSTTFILANEALLRNAIGMESTLPFSIAIILLAMCFIAPIYLLFWSATLRY